jgi:hypothetical protein
VTGARHFRVKPGERLGTCRLYSGELLSAVGALGQGVELSLMAAAKLVELLLGYPAP